MRLPRGSISFWGNLRGLFLWVILSVMALIPNATWSETLPALGSARPPAPVSGVIDPSTRINRHRVWGYQASQRPPGRYPIRLWGAVFDRLPPRVVTPEGVPGFQFSDFEKMTQIADSLQFSFGSLGMMQSHGDPGYARLRNDYPQFPVIGKGYGLPLIYQKQSLFPEHRDRATRLRHGKTTNRQLSTSHDPSLWALEIRPSESSSGDPGLLLADGELWGFAGRNQHRTGEACGRRYVEDLFKHPIEVAPLAKVEQARGSPVSRQFLPSAECDGVGSAQTYREDDQAYRGRRQPVPSLNPRSDEKRRTSCLGESGAEGSPGLYWALDRCLRNPSCQQELGSANCAVLPIETEAWSGPLVFEWSNFSRTYGEKACWYKSPPNASWMTIQTAETEDTLAKAAASFALDYHLNPMLRGWSDRLFQWTCSNETSPSASVWPTLNEVSRSDWPKPWLIGSESLGCESSGMQKKTVKELYWPTTSVTSEPSFSQMEAQCFLPDPAKPDTARVLADSIAQHRKILDVWGISSDNYGYELGYRLNNGAWNKARNNGAGGRPVRKNNEAPHHIVALPMRSDPLSGLERPRFLLGDPDVKETRHHLIGYDSLPLEDASQRLDLGFIQTTETVRSILNSPNSLEWSAFGNVWFPNYTTHRTALLGATTHRRYNQYYSWLKLLGQNLNSFWDEHWFRCNLQRDDAYSRRDCYQKLAAAYMADRDGDPVLLSAQFLNWNSGKAPLRERDLEFPSGTKLRGRSYQLPGESTSWTEFDPNLAASRSFCRVDNHPNTCPAGPDERYSLEDQLARFLLVMSDRREGSSLMIQPQRRDPDHGVLDNYLELSKFVKLMPAPGSQEYVDSGKRTWISLLMDLNTGAPLMQTAGITGRSPDLGAPEHYEVMYRKFERALVLWNVRPAPVRGSSDTGSSWVTLPPSENNEPYLYLRMRPFEGGVKLNTDVRSPRIVPGLHDGGYMVAPLSCAVNSVLDYGKVRTCNQFPVVDNQVQIISEAERPILNACEGVCVPANLCTDPSGCKKIVTIEEYRAGESIRLESGQSVILFALSALPDLFSGLRAVQYVDFRKPPRFFLPDQRTLTQFLGDTSRPARLSLIFDGYTHFLAEPRYTSPSGRTGGLFQFGPLSR